METAKRASAWVLVRERDVSGWFDGWLWGLQSVRRRDGGGDMGVRMDSVGRYIASSLPFLNSFCIRHGVIMGRYEIKKARKP